MPLIVLLITALLLTGCGGGDAGSGIPHAARDTTVTSPAGEAAPAAPLGEVPHEVSHVVLAPDGLEVVTGHGIARPLSFGSAQEAVLTGVASALGAAQYQGRQEECPAGPVGYARYDAGLSLTFQNGAFVGWAARRGSELRTAGGIGPGSTLGEVRAAYADATVEETSLGTEFAAANFHGVATSGSDRGVVEVLFAGTNCIFR